MFSIREIGCNSNVAVHGFVTHYTYNHMRVAKPWLYSVLGYPFFFTDDIAISCDSHRISTVVGRILICGECWLSWLPTVCNHETPV